MVYGEYSAESYTVYSDGEPIYTAGNSQHDSQSYLDAEDGVGLDRMREFCQSTCEEMAEERGEGLGGVELADVDA
jgi:hypothetical protein